MGGRRGAAVGRKRCCCEARRLRRAGPAAASTRRSARPPIDCLLRVPGPARTAACGSLQDPPPPLSDFGRDRAGEWQKESFDEK